MAKAKVELLGASSCMHTRAMREWLEWRGVDFVEYDVEHDRPALERLSRLPGARHTVPVLIEDDVVVQVGWQGRGCVVGVGG